MKTIEIQGSLRKELGKKSSKKIRKSGMVPCVIYGGDENIHFQAHENSFKNLVYTHNAHLVKLDLDGKEMKVVLKDIQFHPVTDRILHADFMQVFDDKPVVISLPVKITGESVGVKAGGKLRVKRRHLKVKGLVADIPDEIVIDITDVKINHSVKVGDLSFERLELLDPKITTILTVATSRVAQKAEEGETAGAETAEAAQTTETPSEK
ncbi:MAG: 50S ribosomal protein L25/general stress protein Ctc [Bacteroidales bacterium]|nr:50S ribosomal protein L25/general stress protein Ctc [Bacteroidales bacterium]